MKATKTWRDMLNESLEDPNFRREWDDANAELAELDMSIAARASACLTQTAVARPQQQSDARQASGRTLTRDAKAL